MAESQSPPEQIPAPGNFARGVFVGGQQELTFLQQQVDDAFRGEGSLVFITGEAGIGKTRLAWEVRPYARSRGFLWLEGRYLRDEAIPFPGLGGSHQSFPKYRPTGHCRESVTALRCGAGQVGARGDRAAERSVLFACP